MGFQFIHSHVSAPFSGHLTGDEVSHSSSVLPQQRILFIGEAVSLAHVGRPLVLARWARESGCDVHFACGGAFASVARADGFATHELKTIDARTFYSRLNAGKFFYAVDELEDYVRSELTLIEEVQPDLVVGDFRLTLPVSTTLSGVRLLSLNNAHWSPAANCRFPAPNAGIFRALPSTLCDWLFALIRPLAFQTFAQSLNVVRRRFGLSSLKDFREHYTAGDYCAYLDLPELFDDLVVPRGHFFLGPVAWEPRYSALPGLGTLGAKRYLAYVTLGSSGDRHLLPGILRALLNANCDIALSGVNTEQTNLLRHMLPDLDDRFVAAPLFNPIDVLKRAAVTVCHGGSGTIYQSLSAGVPVLAIPGNPDQALASEAMAAQGAGVCVPLRSIARCLPPLLGEVLNSVRFKQCAKKVARMLSHHDTRLHWLKFLKTIPANAPAVH